MKRNPRRKIPFIWIFLGLLCLTTNSTAQFSWNSQEWGFRRAIMVDNGSGNTLTDYQVKVTLSSSFNFSRCKPDGSDIRFTSSDSQTLIPYWIEEWNPPGSSATIWVKVPNIPAGGTTIYLYYDNPSAEFPSPLPPSTTNLPPTGPWTNVAGLVINGSPGSLLAENMVKDGSTYWQLFTDRSACNGQLGFAYNNTGNPANNTGWNWSGDVTIDFSIRNSTPMFAGDPRMNTNPGNLLNPYLDCPHVEKGDDGYWYLFYHWIVGGDPHGGYGSPTSVMTTQTPDSEFNDGPYELGMKFKSAQSGRITKIRYYKTAGETGSHSGKIWSSDGTLLATVNFVSETASGWQEAALSVPLYILENTTYIVSVNSNTAYGATNYTFDSPVVNGSLTGIADGNNGVYSESPGGFPSTSFRNSNYFRDVVFESTSGCGVHGAWSWTPDSYAAIGVARSLSITGPYVEVDPIVLMSSEMEGDSHAWDWARVSEPYVFKRDDGKWVMLFMGDKGNYDNPGDPSLLYIEQCSYAVADNIQGPYVKWHGGADPFIAFGPPGSLDAGTIADAHPVKFGDTYYIFYAASPTTWGWNTMYLTTSDWETVTKSTHYVYTNDGNSPFRGAISTFNDTYYFSYLGSSSSSPGPFMIATQPSTGFIPGLSLYGPDAVFNFYDGFDGTSFDPAKWHGVDPGYSGSVVVAGGEMQICNSGGFLTQVTADKSFGIGHTLEVKAKHSVSGFAGEIGFGRQESGGNWGGPPFGFKNQRIMDLRVINGSNFVVDADNADHVESPGDYVSTTTPLDFNNYLVHKVMRVDNSTTRFQLDNFPVTTITNTIDRPARITTDLLSPWFFILGGSCVNVDWVRVRKYAEPEPGAFVGPEELYNCYADLSITKTVDNINPDNGDQITFTITVSNDGPGNSAWARVADILPNGLEYISHSTINGTYDPLTGIWDVGFITVGSSAVLSITVEVDIFTSAFDFGPATGFNLFVLEDLNQPSSDTQGKVAVGRDAYFANYSVGDQLPNSNGTVDVLITGRNLTYISGGIYGGNVVYGNTTNLPISAVSILHGTLRQDYPIDFAAAGTFLNNLSTQLSLYTVNGTSTIQWGGITLTGNDPFLNIFSISGSDLSSANNVTINVPNGSVVLVNIDGTSVSWMGGLTVNGTAVTNVLYNFYQATSLTIQGIDVRGSILAPLATVNFSSGVQNGQMICKNLFGQGQFNLALFSGNIPLPPDITNIVEITDADQDDRDSTPGNGDPDEDDYASITINVNISQTPGDDWHYVGQFANGEIVYSLAYDNGGNILAGTWGGKIYRSSNNGQSFSRINNDMNVGLIWSIAVNSSGDIFAGTEQGIFRSTDNGTTWNLIGLQFKDVRSIIIDNTGVVYAGTWGFGVFKSVDNGLTWSSCSSGLTIPTVNAIANNSASQLFAATFGNGVFKSVNNADSWTDVNVGSALVWSLAVASNDYLFAGTYGDGLYRSEDNGFSWSKLTNGLNAPFIYSIQIDPNDKIYVSSWTSGVFASSDYGDTWTSLGMGGFGVSSILINPSMDQVFVGTKDGKIYAKSGELTSVDDNRKELPSEFSLMQNYPNPFNPTTVIEFGLPESGNYIVKVFNVLGQTVAVLADREFSAGYHKVIFDASRLSSGIYFYQLNGNRVNIIKKMLLVK